MRYMIDTYGNVDLGTLDWEISGPNFYTYGIQNKVKKPKDNYTIANIYCNLYRAVPLTASFVEGDMAVGESGALYLRDTRYTTTAEFKEAMRGQILRYELETPANGGYLPMYKGRYKVSDVCQLLDKSKYPATQTINCWAKIKQMRYMIDTYGNVDLGTLDWEISGLNFYTYGIQNKVKKPKDNYTIANIYCNLYRAVPLNASFVEGDMAVGESGTLYLRDTRYTTTAEFKEAMRGQILRYELETPANGGYLPLK